MASKATAGDRPGKARAHRQVTDNWRGSASLMTGKARASNGKAKASPDASKLKSCQIRRGSSSPALRGASASLDQRDQVSPNAGELDLAGRWPSSWLTVDQRRRKKKREKK